MSRMKKLTNVVKVISGRNYASAIETIFGSLPYTILTDVERV